MNCQLCQKEFDAYREGILPEGARSQVEAHLGECKVCTDSFQLEGLAAKVMEEEKSMQSNPFLVTRIMANIGELEQYNESVLQVPFYQKVLRQALVVLSVAAAIFIGIVVGNFDVPAQSANKLPVEMTLMNDMALESVNLFSQL